MKIIAPWLTDTQDCKQASNNQVCWLLHLIPIVSVRLWFATRIYLKTDTQVIRIVPNVPQMTLYITFKQTTIYDLQIT